MDGFLKSLSPSSPRFQVAFFSYSILATAREIEWGNQAGSGGAPKKAGGSFLQGRGEAGGCQAPPFKEEMGKDVQHPIPRFWGTPCHAADLRGQRCYREGEGWKTVAHPTLEKSEFASLPGSSGSHRRCCHPHPEWRKWEPKMQAPSSFRAAEAPPPPLKMQWPRSCSNESGVSHTWAPTPLKSRLGSGRQGVPGFKGRKENGMCQFLTPDCARSKSTMAWRVGVKMVLPRPGDFAFSFPGFFFFSFL